LVFGVVALYMIAVHEFSDLLNAPKWIRILFTHILLIPAAVWIVLKIITTHAQQTYEANSADENGLNSEEEPALQTSEERMSEQNRAFKTKFIIAYTIALFAWIIGSMVLGGVWGAKLAEKLLNHHPETNFVIVLADPPYLFATFGLGIQVLLLSIPLLIYLPWGGRTRLVREVIYDQYGERFYKHFIRRFILPSVPFTLLYTWMVFDTYARFAPTYIAINNFLSFTERQYAYSEIEGVYYYTHRIVPRILGHKKIVESPHFLIRFRDGFEYDTGSTNYTHNLEALEPLMQSVAQRAGVPFSRVDRREPTQTAPRP